MAETKKQRGATKARLEYRAAQLTGPVAQQVAEYNAIAWKQERDARVARRLAKLLRAVSP